MIAAVVALNLELLSLNPPFFLSYIPDVMSIGTEVNSTEENAGTGGRLYQVPTSVVVILSLFYGLISLTAFVGNSLVIYVVVISR